jgi:hypothetical protein
MLTASLPRATSISLRLSVAVASATLCTALPKRRASFMADFAGAT